MWLLCYIFYQVYYYLLISNLVKTPRFMLLVLFMVSVILFMTWKDDAFRFCCKHTYMNVFWIEGQRNKTDFGLLQLRYLIVRVQYLFLLFHLIKFIRLSSRLYVMYVSTITSRTSREVFLYYINKCIMTSSVIHILLFLLWKPYK